MLAIQNALLMGHDTLRHTITGINHSLMKNQRYDALDINAHKCDDMHIDLFCMLDRISPSTQLYGLVEHLYQKSPNTPILAYHTQFGIYASFDGINWKYIWKEDVNNKIMTFMGTFVHDPTDMSLYMVRRGSGAADLQTYQITNY